MYAAAAKSGKPREKQEEKQTPTQITNKSAGPKYNQRSTRLPCQNHITSSRRKLFAKTYTETKKRLPVAWWNKEWEI